MVDEGNANAEKVLALQEHPGHFFTVVQIGVNAVAILGGIVGEAAFTPFFARVLGFFLSPELAQSLGFLASFLLVTSLFILFADLTPKRLGMVAAETVAVRIVRPMLFMVLLFAAGVAVQRVVRPVAALGGHAHQPARRDHQ